MEPALSGDPPNPIDPPSGCRFHTRCPIVGTVCSQKEPALAQRAHKHLVSCHAHDPASGYKATPSTKEAAE